MDKDSSTSSMKLEDIYFVLFRHKWKIVCGALLGILGAAAVWKWSPRDYQSEAKLLVRYIVQTTPLLRPGGDQQVQVVDSRGESLMSTELEILASEDLARSVAQMVGPERIAGPKAGLDPLGVATASIVNGLALDVQGRSTVIQVGFTHPDPDVCRDVVRSLIDAYLALHTEMRMAGATYDLMAKEAEERKESLRQTELKLQKLREQTGGVSLEDAKRTVALEIETLRKSILETESELSGRQAILDLDLDRAATGTNTHALASPKPHRVEDRLAYQAILSQLRELRLREQEYLSRFTEENPLVVNVRKQVQQAEGNIARMLAEHPGLEAIDAPAEGPGGAASTSDAPSTMALVTSLRAKLETLKGQLQKSREESIRLSELETEMVDVQSTRQIQEESLHYLVTTLEQTRYNSAIQAGMHSSINIMQAPTDPWVDSKPMKKLAMMVCVGFTGAGVGVAFLLEMFLDPRVKRSSQLVRGLNLPVYASIPAAPRRRRLAGSGWVESRGSGAAEEDGIQVSVPELARGANGQRSHYEALRDRLIVYFERVNLRRKPKLVGLTACHANAGVSSIAEGLAATLSETGGGKVLLVDLNVGKGSVQHYHMGRPTVSLPALLEGDGSPCVPGTESGTESGLMLASLEESEHGYHPIRSREFDALIPKLKASDFDYVVFDMPPLNSTSVSFRLAGFFDKVLVVAEAERTHMESLKSSLALLQESNSKVALIMNKAREYVPQWLRPPQ